MNRQRTAVALFLLSAWICVCAAPVASGAPDQQAGVLPPGFVCGETGAIAPDAGLDGAPAPLAFPNHPGWPVPVQGGASPPVCADIDPAYPGLEILVGTLTSAANLYAFHEDGTPVSGFPIDLGFFVAASPSIGDLDADGDLEIVAGDFGSNQVWALHANGTPLPGWPIPVGANVRSTAALADLDPAFPGLEVIVGVQDGTVQAWHADATPVPGWPVTAGNFVERCSPAVGDVDGDGSLEVFVGSWYDYGQGSTGGIYAFDANGAPLPGWPLLTNHISVLASPALADLDGDGDQEIIVGTYETNGKMHVWHHDGTEMTGWPFTIPRGSSSTSYVCSSPAVGDIDGDGELEIVDGSCGQCGTVYAWRRDGTVLPGWPFVANAVIDGSSPSLGDLDGDGRIEIVIGSGSGFTPYGCSSGAISKAYILRDDGTVLPGWPVDLGTATPPYPALADVDGNGSVEVVLAFSQTVYVWDAPGPYVENLVPWAYYHLGIDHTGDFRLQDPTHADEAASPLSGAWVARPNPRVGDGLVFVARRGVRMTDPITVFDAAGRRIRSLTDGVWDGRDALGAPVPSGMYLLREAGAGAAGGTRVAILR
jgi:hypothetical protein